MSFRQSVSNVVPPFHYQISGEPVPTVRHLSDNTWLEALAKRLKSNASEFGGKAPTPKNAADVELTEKQRAMFDAINKKYPSKSQKAADKADIAAVRKALAKNMSPYERFQFGIGNTVDDMLGIKPDARFKNMQRLVKGGGAAGAAGAIGSAAYGIANNATASGEDDSPKTSAAQEQKPPTDAETTAKYFRTQQPGVFGTVSPEGVKTFFNIPDDTSTSAFERQWDTYRNGARAQADMAGMQANAHRRELARRGLRAIVSPQQQALDANEQLARARYIEMGNPLNDPTNPIGMARILSGSSRGGGGDSVADAIKDQQAILKANAEAYGPDYYRDTKGLPPAFITTQTLPQQIPVIDAAKRLTADRRLKGQYANTPVTDAEMMNNVQAAVDQYARTGDYYGPVDALTRGDLPNAARAARNYFIGKRTVPVYAAGQPIGYQDVVINGDTAADLNTLRAATKQ